MRKFFVCLGLLLFFANTSNAQYLEKSLGLRFGGGIGYGAAISYQTPLAENRLEFDLGWGGNSNWNHWGLTGVYQWLFPIESGFQWYVGAGAIVGGWNEKVKYLDHSDGGMYLGAALNGGIEYFFSEIPIQLALDLRPELGLINNYSNGGLNIGLAVRYRFGK